MTIRRTSTVWRLRKGIATEMQTSKAIRDNFREAVTIAKEVASGAPCGAKGWARRRQLAVRISKFKSLAWDFSRSFGLRSRVGERVGVRGPHDAPAPAVAAERRESRLLRRRRAIDPFQVRFHLRGSPMPSLPRRSSRQRPQKLNLRRPVAYGSSSWCKKQTHALARSQYERGGSASPIRFGHDRRCIDQRR